MGYAPDSVTARCATFIAKATLKHAGRFIYDDVAASFINSKTKVEIVCPEHGPFWQPPQDHVRGQRCPDCSARRGSSRSARLELFLRKARATHGDRYGYDAVTYIDQHTPVTVRCDVHGDFDQLPHLHVAGALCPTCAEPVRKHNASRADNAGRFGHPQRPAAVRRVEAARRKGLATSA